MTNKGKILRVRPGHEANCSSGMVPLYLLILGGGSGLLITVGAAIAQAVEQHKWPAVGQRKRAATGRLGKGYLVIPLVLVLVVLTGLGLWLYGEAYSHIDEALIVLLCLGLAASAGGAMAAGYRLAPRVGYGILLISPLVFLAGTVLSAVIAFYLPSVL